MAIDGSGSNADAIGAKIRVTGSASSGETKSQLKEVLGSSTFLSMNSLDTHFGVGGAESVDVEIEWPSGRVSQLSDLEVNRLHQVTEPED